MLQDLCRPIDALLKAQKKRSFRDALNHLYKDKLKNLFLQKMVRNLENFMNRVDTQDGYASLSACRLSRKAAQVSREANLQKILWTHKAK